MNRPDAKELFEKVMKENDLFLNINAKIVTTACADGSVIARPVVELGVTYAEATTVETDGNGNTKATTRSKAKK